VLSTAFSGADMETDKSLFTNGRATVLAKAVPLRVAETVTVSATAFTTCPLARPRLLVGAAGWMTTVLPVAKSSTVASGIGLLSASRAVTVTVMVVCPSAGALAGEKVIVESAALTGPGMKLTVPC